MNSVSTPTPSALSTESPPSRLRAIVEVIGGELSIYPIADADIDERAVLDALRFVIADGKKAAA